mgnify:CR=1 FL=1
MSAGDTAREPASEQTPLLRDSPNSDANENTPLHQEPSTKELIWILGSIWLGVFLAALGMDFNFFRSIIMTDFGSLQIQQSLPRFPRLSLRPSTHSRCSRG